MKRTFNRVFPIVIVVAMVFTALPLGAFAAEGDAQTLGQSGTITGFTAPDDIEVEIGTAKADIPFPETVTATVALDAVATPAQLGDETTDIAVAVDEWQLVAWQTFDPDTAGRYVFEAVRESMTLPDGITLPDDFAELPCVAVVVGEVEPPEIMPLAGSDGGIWFSGSTSATHDGYNHDDQSANNLGTATWNHTTHTLTLDNFTRIISASGTQVISFENLSRDVTIKLIGDSYITTKYNGNNPTIGLEQDDDSYKVTITSDVSDASVTFKSGKSTQNGSYGINVAGDLAISGVTVSAEGDTGDAGAMGYGVKVGGDLTVSDGGILEALGADYAITVAGTAPATAVGGGSNIDDTPLFFNATEETYLDTVDDSGSPTKYVKITSAAAPAGTATVSDRTISGTVGTALPSGTQITITISGDSISSYIAFNDPVFASMIQNLPAGMRVIARNNVNNGATAFNLEVGGDTSIPTETASGPLEIVIPGSILTGGQDITVTSNANTKWDITAGGTAPTVTTTALSGGTVGTPYSQTLTATGDAPITWSISGVLPTGLSLNATTGIISGTPTTAGMAYITIVAENAAGRNSKSGLTILITGGGGTPVQTYTVSGIVNDYTDSPVSGATVTIMLGNETKGTQTTQSDGTFSFTNITPGLYNLVIVSGGQKITVIVTITNADVSIPITSTTLPQYIQNSEVEVKQNAPVQAVVGGLQEIFSKPAVSDADTDKGFTATDLAAIANGSTGAIKVVVDEIQATADQTTIENAAGSATVGLFIDLSVFKAIDSTETQLTELPSLLTVTFDLPAALQGKTISAIYRAHGNGVDTITTSGTEYFSQSGNTITLKVKKFSTYGLAYTDTPAPPPSSSSSGGGSSKQDSTPAPNPWLEPTPAQTLATSANKAQQDSVRTKSTDRYGVRKASWKNLKGYRYYHDTMDGNAVQVRLYIDNPTAMTRDTYVTGFVKGSFVENRKAMFEKWFTNQIRVIHMDEANPWGQTVRIAAKIDLASMDTTSLYFYSYDKATNKYTRIADPQYRIDKNGYLHFYTELAGDIIISENPLEKR